jgi:hypothetical protein
MSSSRVPQPQAGSPTRSTLLELQGQGLWADRDEDFAEPAKLAEVTGDDPVGGSLDLPDALPVMLQGIGDGEPVLDGGLHFYEFRDSSSLIGFLV